MQKKKGGGGEGINQEININTTSPILGQTAISAFW